MPPAPLIRRGRPPGWLLSARSSGPSAFARASASESNDSSISGQLLSSTSLRAAEPRKKSPGCPQAPGDFVPDLPKVGIKTILRGAVGQVGEQLIPAEVMASCPERMGSGRSLSGEDACELIELEQRQLGPLLSCHLSLMPPAPLIRRGRPPGRPLSARSSGLRPSPVPPLRSLTTRPSPVNSFSSTSLRAAEPRKKSPGCPQAPGDFVPDLPKVGIKTILRGAVGQVGEQLIPAEVMASCPERMGSGRSLSGEDACELIELNSGSWDHSSAATFL